MIWSLAQNTIDAVAPSSSVAPLPALSGPQIPVHWSGTDDPGGSGLASYDVYVRTDGGNSVLWLNGTMETNAVFTGTPGHSYAFHTVARDWVDNEEAPPALPDAQATVPANAPVLAGISNLTANVGQALNIRNTLLNGTPFGSFIFSLGYPVPPGVSINPTNGILRWTPSCSQASRTNQITVRITDTGNTNITDSASFIVTVGECVVPGLGRVVLATGDSGRVPVNLIASVPLTNLSMTVETATNRLINFSLEPIVPEICVNSLVFIGTNAPPHPDPLPLGV